MYHTIIHILNSWNMAYQEIDHEATTSCEHSKILRNQQWLQWLWSKNIVFHCKGNFYMLITHADKKINAKRFKHEFGSKDIRFATADEITEQIGGTIGCIPSFGFDNTQIPLYVDADIFVQEYFLFNPDTPLKSIQIATKDLLAIYKQWENPVKFFRWGEETMEIVEL